MKHKLSKKVKIFLSVASAITANTAVATLLTSCSFSNKVNDIGGFDKEYGINNATYTRMEKDFEVLYRSQLDQRKESGEINDDAYDSNLYAFQKKLNSLHTSLYSGENKTLSYTIKTNVLRDYARDNYGIRLSRQSSVILDEAIKNIKSSIISSVLLMCNEYGITDTSKYSDSANIRLDELEKEAKAKYGDTDVVSIIQYIQSGMATCFNGICEQLDCLATQQQLKQFIEKYSINVKEDVADDYCWDKLFSQYGEGNKEISAEDFNNIFEISCEDSDPQNSYGSYTFTSRKTVKFKSNIIPGYTLKPILVKMNGDPYTNTYSIDVDYTLVNDSYINNENVARLTAHSSALENKSFYEDENISIFDLNTSDEEREYTNYVLPITKEYEEEQINTTYFNNEDFTFSWSTSDEYGYDDFWTTANENSEYKSKLDISSLATTGMMINGVLLSDILSQAGKISLSDGSYELNGVEKSGGSDTKQWKLIVDDNEIKDEDIRWELIPATTIELPNSISITNGFVSWTNQIVAGIYQFCILANYKKTKIQSAPITLTISSKQSKNAEDFNHNTKNILYDENTIDQKLFDFVNNVDFSLDFTEQDYDTDIDGKKGEIQVNDFIIGYKNSKNTFKVSNLINEVISNAINNDSGITKRFTKNIWQDVKADYDSVVSTVNDKLKELKKFADSTHDEIDSIIQSFRTTSIVFAAVLTVYSIIMFTIFYFCKKCSNKYAKLKDQIKNWTLLIIIISTFVLANIASIIAILFRLDKPNENLKDKLDVIDPEKQASSNLRIVKNINNDKKYFDHETGKAKFDNLPSAEIRSKKIYYHSGYKSRTNDVLATETESDLDEYLGGRNATEEIIKDLGDIANGFYWLIPLDVLCGLLLLFLFYLTTITILTRNVVKEYAEYRKATEGYPNIQNVGQFLKSKGSVINKAYNQLRVVKKGYESLSSIFGLNGKL